MSRFRLNRNDRRSAQVSWADDPGTILSDALGAASAHVVVESACNISEIVVNKTEKDFALDIVADALSEYINHPGGENDKEAYLEEVRNDNEGLGALVSKADIDALVKHPKVIELLRENLVHVIGALTYMNGD